MTNQSEIKLSVRNLVEFIFRSGDLNSQFISNTRALEGTRAHQKIQKANAAAGYLPEVPLRYSHDYQDFTFLIEGRMDGIFTRDDRLVIDEIKSTTCPLDQIEEDFSETHWAQAKCYGFIYCTQNQLEEIDIQLTYYQLETESIKKFTKSFTKEALAIFFVDLLDRYLIWANLTADWQSRRNQSIKNLAFPYPSYRPGQRQLAVAVYKTIGEQKKLFAQAPTGIGKTISTLFPSIKATGEGLTERLFYLTAKTIVREVAEEAFNIMKTQGLLFKTVTLTAKDKICFKEERVCDPEYCEFARGYFNRVNDALYQALNEEQSFTRGVIENYCRTYEICPFEFSLELTNWADCIICDYNYVFDPRIYLKQFFYENGGAYTFLIDEAHNLVDRARSMFSAELGKKKVLELKKIFRDLNPGISKTLGKLNTFLITMRKLTGDGHFYQQPDAPKEIYPLLNGLIAQADEWLAQNEGSDAHNQLLEFYFEALTFMRIAELYDQRYLTYVENNRDDTIIKLFCLDPSYLLEEAMKRGKAAILFSATLSPLDYFTEILGGGTDSYRLRLPSPFAVENRALLVSDRISTKFKNRDQTTLAVSESIKTVLDHQEGNYMVYFPSYAYLNAVFDCFTENYPEVPLIKQGTAMTETEREAFLSHFKSEHSGAILGFCVLGGIFSEGVDLKHEGLIGSIIIGVGLPQICFERDIIKNYFQLKNQRGFEYAYVYPGMSKVLQAAGRVIRTESDRGVILLIDERFSHNLYQQLFPSEWFPHQKIRSLDDLKQELKLFWQNTADKKKT
jgi:Rad3-related DNA helicase